MPLLPCLLAGIVFFWITAVADILGEIGPPAQAALPRLRELLAYSYEWVRVHCAAAIWKSAAKLRPPAVLDTLLQAWVHNPQRPIMSWPAWTGWAPPQNRPCRCSARN